MNIRRKTVISALAAAALAATLAAALASCEQEPVDTLNGTWELYGNYLILDNGRYEKTENIYKLEKGTYSTRWGDITMTVTEVYFDEWRAEYYNTTEGWKTRSQMAQILRDRGDSEDSVTRQLESWYSTTTESYTLWGNTLTIGGEVYTRVR